jgi:hypothetical protein
LYAQDPRKQDFGIFVVDVSDTPVMQDGLDLPKSPRPLRNSEFMGDVFAAKAR